MFQKIKKIIPKSIFVFFQPAYHYSLALIGALIYRFPSKKIVVIGVTGTKGKTTTVEIVNTIFEKAGYQTALQSTLHFKIGKKDQRNLFKISMPGRFFMQKFLREALNKGCSHAILEMTSEGAKQFRHKFIDLDALIFTNLAPEHIESHGSYENYVRAKLSIAKEMENSKKNCAVIANIDDQEAKRFLSLNIKNKLPYSFGDAINVKADENGSSFQIDKTVIHSKLPGTFNVSNMIGAITCARFFGISDEIIKNALENINLVRGRMEKINVGQSFDVVVDYAHTPDSLKAVYETYAPHLTKSAHRENSSSLEQKKYNLICILGNTGGGRDTWKRPEMGKIADQYCQEIILTNEDPYDENPESIVSEIKDGIKNKPVTIIMDRREAIRQAIKKVVNLQQTQGANKDNYAILITGKGTDPYIMEANGKKTPWDDATVAKEELNKIINQ
jgi:UDP-N-acetylmuramoyl-L-alanyl-D-glutamate--2,6-diaminopimelate ligase